MKIAFRLPQTGSEPHVNRHCPICGYNRMHIHQHQRERPISDFKLDTIHQVRVKCPQCSHTATCHPATVGPGRHRSNAVVAFGVLLYALGLSYRGVSSAVRALVGVGCPTTVYRDVMRACGQARELHEKHVGRAVRVAGVDGTGQKTKGGCVGVAFAVDAQGQKLLAAELVEEDDPQQVAHFLQDLCEQYEIDTIITDEHSSYKEAIDEGQIDVEHRLCEAHWKKSKQLRIARLRTQAARRGWTQFTNDLDRLSNLVRHRPRDGPEGLRRTHERYLRYAAPRPGKTWTLGYHLRMLTLHLMDTWDQVGIDDQPTNNTAERLIGLLLKIRSKTMRGFAIPDHVVLIVYLIAYLWDNPHCDLAALC